MTYKLDMSMMLAVHNALRRELERITEVAARPGDEPAQVLRTALGWELFKNYLHVHHSTEAASLSPVMERKLADRPSELALLAAMESEHAAIDPLLVAIDSAIARGEPVDELTAALLVGVTGHLAHEEKETLPLIDATLTEEEWNTFGQAHGKTLGPDGSRYIPWVMDDLPEAEATALLNRFPEPVRLIYTNEWQKSYQDLTLYP